MGWFSSLLSRRSTLATPSQWMTETFAPASSAGVSVTPSSALTCSAVYACVRVLSETVASLPLVLYRRNGRGKSRAIDHPLYSLLHDAPNPDQTSFEWRELLQTWLGLRGNSFVQIVRDGRGDVAALWPLDPQYVTISTNASGATQYTIRIPGRSEVVLSASEVLHLKALSSDGVVGLSPITQAKQAIGMALAAEDYAARLYANDARPRGVLEVPGMLGKNLEEAKQIRSQMQADWQAGYAGENRGKIAILDNGLKFNPISITPEDAQFLETRKFEVSEIARIFRVPPHLIGDLDRATFSNIEHQSIEFVTHTMRPWFVRWEQALNRALLQPSERNEYYFEFLVDGLLRGDIVSRYNAYSVGRQWGWLSANDVRGLENMDPLPGDQGDMYLMPMNMIDAANADMLEHLSINNPT